MAIKEKADLKKLFETTDKPTQQDFADWLDSFVHVNEYTVVQLIKATIAQAKAGTDNNTYITPLSLLETIKENAIEKATRSELTAGIDENKYVTPKIFNSAFGIYVQIHLATLAEARAGLDSLKLISPLYLRKVLLDGPPKRTLTYRYTDTVSYTGTVSNDLEAPDETARLVKIARGVDVNNGVVSFAIVAEQEGIKHVVKMTVSKGLDGKPTIQKDFKSANTSATRMLKLFVSGANSALQLDIYMRVDADTNNGTAVTVSTFSLLSDGIDLINPEIVYYRDAGSRIYIDSEYYGTQNIQPNVDGDTVVEFTNSNRYSWYRQI